ncbi:hypothetical protein [uncultured Brevundimonas sp.]|uniref:hypothetical protein n=1 Tax=uncultured Brevundimonas sp. TaxID=213418 RepID=UPI0025E4D228|nr:hypothetical protein [uncultured Brevundimonas sp.]
MTPHDLHARLDAMQADAGDDDSRKPGLITVQTEAWIDSLHAEAAPPRTIVDGIRIRGVKVAVGALEKTAVLARGEAGLRGEPYRDLEPRA